MNWLEQLLIDDGVPPAEAKRDAETLRAAWRELKDRPLETLRKLWRGKP